MPYRTNLPVVCWLFVVAIGCSTPGGCESDDTPGVDNDTVEQTEGEDEQPLVEIDDPSIDEPQGADEEAARWMRAGPGTVVLKIHPDAVADDILPIADSVTADLTGEQNTEWLELLLDTGPMKAFEPDVIEGELLEHWDRERATYISHQPLAGDSSYFETMVYGSVLQSDLVGPAGIHYRVLLPTDDPEELTDALGEYTAEHHDVTAVFTPGEHFVRIDVAEFTPRGIDGIEAFDRFDVDPDEWERALLDQAESQRGDDRLRPTPAFETFSRSTAGASVYFRSEDLRMTQVAQALLDAQRALETASPDRRQEILARGVALAMNALMFSPVSQFDHEDTVLELRGHDTDGLVVDTASTKTEQGRALTDHVGEPARHEDAPAVSAPMIDLRWNFDPAAALEDIPVPMSEDIDEPNDPMHMIRPVMEYFRQGGALSYLPVLFVNPSLVARVVASGDDAVVPQLGRLAIQAHEEGQFDTPEIAGTASFDAEDVEQHPPASIAAMLAELEADGVDIELASPEDDPTRLDLTTGEAVTQSNSEPLEFESAPLRGQFDLSALAQILSDNPELSEVLDELGQLTVAWDSDSETTRQRYAFGDVHLERPDIADVSDFEPIEPGPHCTHQLVHEAIGIFASLERIEPDMPFDEIVAMTMEHYDRLAEECAGEDAELEEHLELARARMRFLLIFRRAPHTDDAGAVYDTICEVGDPVMCEE